MPFDHTVLKRIRKRHPSHPTQDEIAELLGITRATYGKKEIGKLPVSLKELDKLAEFYHIQLKEFFNEDMNEGPGKWKGEYFKEYNEVIVQKVEDKIQELFVDAVKQFHKPDQSTLVKDLVKLVADQYAEIVRSHDKIKELLIQIPVCEKCPAGKSCSLSSLKMDKADTSR